jgi:hypothetical protein
MLKAKLAKEVVLKLQNDVGALHRIARTVSDKGVNILGTSTWVDHDQAVVHLMTDDNLRVVDALRAAGWSPREADVVVMEVAHKPGMLRGLTDKLAQVGIDLHHLYATAPTSQDRCLVVFASANNDRAVVVLND